MGPEVDSKKAWAVALGITVRELRKRADLSQERFAHLFSVTRNHVQKIEHGATQIPLDHLVSIAEVFGVRLPDLLAQAEVLVLAPEKMKSAVKRLKQDAVRGRPRKPLK